MFFIISKLVAFFTAPSNVAAMLCALGVLLLATRWRRHGARVMATGIMLLLIFGFSSLGDALMLGLSERFPAWKDNERHPVGIIVLGGAIGPKISQARGAVELNASAERMTTVAALARQFPNARIVFTGGDNSVFDAGPSEAQFAGPLLESFGISHERILLEGKSRTTAENATMTRDLVRPKPGELWLLVTSAVHMPRSMGVFRAAGFEVDAYPVDWRTKGWVDAVSPFFTLSAGLARLDTSVHEWIGLIGYRLSGRTKELLPSPR